MRKNMRRRYFISKEFQLKYVGLILALMFLTAVVCSYAIYYTMMVHLGGKLANVYPQGKLIAIVNTINLRIIFSLLLISPIVVIIGIFLSHRIAGPIFRMERDLRNIAVGDLTVNIVLRQKDELKTVASGINELTRSFKTTVSAQKDRLNRASAYLKALKSISKSGAQDPAAIADAITRLDEEVKGLAKELKSASNVEGAISTKLDTELRELSKELDRFKL